MKELTVYVNEAGYIQILNNGASVIIDMHDELDGLYSRLEAVIYERDAMADHYLEADYQSADATDPYWDYDFDDGTPF